MLNEIIQWGHEEEPVKAIILVGSRARSHESDRFADYDLSIFCDDHTRYTGSEAWLSRFGKVWICVKEKVAYKQNSFPSRLVIFEGGTKIDFVFFPVSLCQKITHTLPLEYTEGYKILLDKEGLAKNWPVPQTEAKAIKPSEEEFSRIVQEFWFEVYHVAVSLKRGDLWTTKLRSWSAQNFFLQMIKWHSEAKNNWTHTVPSAGKRMDQWVESGIWNELHGVFGQFSPEDSWKSLFNMMKLFDRLVRETGVHLGFESHQQLASAMNKFVSSLLDSPLEKEATDGLRFRQAKLEDLEAIIHLLLDDQLGKERETISSLKHYQETFFKITCQSDSELIVAELNQKIIGFLQITYLHHLTYQGSKVAHIESVRIDASQRNKGFGKQLFQWVIERAKRLGCQRMQLMTDKKRTDAYRFYESVGFSATHEGMKLSLKTPT